ncbi:HYDIN protein, partial [Phainopepla nitens]|nr:HYDIN protein [Phainopepla nitens]
EEEMQKEEERQEEEKQKEEERKKEEKKQKEEEKQKKEKKRVSLGKQPITPEKEETKTSEKKETKSPEEKTKPPEKEPKAPEKEEPKVPEKTEIPEMKETKASEDGETEIPEDPAEMEENLILRFQIYESSQPNVAQVFSYWNRVQGTVQLPVMQIENTSQPSAEKKGKKTKKRQQKVGQKPEQKSRDQRNLQSSELETQSKVAEEAVRDAHVGVPCLDIQVTDPKTMVREILSNGSLPTEDQMLRHVGLHPEGPPLPPAAVLSMVDYPEERLGSAERAKAPDEKGSSDEGQPKTGEADSRDKSLKDQKISTPRTESPQDSSATRSTSMLKSASIPTEFLSLKRYRWIVPAHGEVELKVHFSTKEAGMFEQTLRFELVESKRQYKLSCSATGLYPSISQDPRLVFPQWRETMEEDEIIFKEYVESTKQFHFGPLLCGKSREWYVLPAGPCTF